MAAKRNALPFFAFLAMLGLELSTPEAAHGGPDLAGDVPPEQRARWRAIIPWSDECEEGFAPDSASTAGLRFHPLDAGRYLVEITCLLGAYQRDYEFFLYDEASRPPVAKPLSLVFYGWDERGKNWRKSEIRRVTGTAEFDGATRQLKIYSKFRGIGVCGSMAKYQMEGDRLRLLEFLGKPTCDDPDEAWRRIGP